MDVIGTVLSICVLEVILVPILGGIWLGMRMENRAKRLLLKAMWTHKKRGTW
jgi:hypothetical protein